VPWRSILPWPSNPKLAELDLTTEWLPGDVIVYGDGDFAINRVRHVNLYVGRFSGVDRRGRELRYGDNYEIVNPSIDWMARGVERGIGIIALTLHYCINVRCNCEWVKRVRLVQIPQAYDND